MRITPPWGYMGYKLIKKSNFSWPGPGPDGTVGTVDGGGGVDGGPAGAAVYHDL